ncbi:MAG: DUF6268 family outer membrane beta-barrel protein [Planctomycetota bacterium]
MLRYHCLLQKLALAAAMLSLTARSTVAQEFSGERAGVHAEQSAEDQRGNADAVFPEGTDSPFISAGFSRSDLQAEMEFNRPVPFQTQPESTTHHAPRTLDCEAPLSRFRCGCFQGAAVSTAFINDNAATGLGVTSTDVSASFAIPLGSFDNVIVATPFLRTDFLTPAAALDLPGELYETGARFFWRRPLNEDLSVMAIVTPAMRTDFENTDNAFRIFGLGLLIWQAVPETLAFSGGIVHTGRDDFPVLPAAGLLWTPSREWKVDLQFPSPRVSYRLDKNGSCSETWTYISGVFGGNTWSVQRSAGNADELTLRDYRLMAGFEHLLPENRSIFVEGGFVFGRAVEYESSPDSTELDSAGIIRCGLAF